MRVWNGSGGKTLLKEPRMARDVMVMETVMPVDC